MRLISIPHFLYAVLQPVCQLLSCISCLLCLVATTPAQASEGVRANTTHYYPDPRKAADVRGRVLNEEGRPLVGATVLWKGSPFGVTTDSDGNYQLPLAAGRTVVVFSYAGYTDDEVSVRGAGIQNITLIPKEAPAASRTPANERRLRRVFK